MIAWLHVFPLACKTRFDSHLYAAAAATATAACWFDLGQKTKYVEGFLPPEHPIFNSADQSDDKSSSTATKHSSTERKMQEKSRASPGSGSILGTIEDSPLPKRGREKLASLLADLLGFPSADRQPEAKTNGLNLYESMSPALGSELRSAPAGTCAPLPDPQQEGRAVIYENCLKCQRDRCQPPPRALPAEMFRNRNIIAPQTFPHPKGSQEHGGAVNEEWLGPALSDGSHSEDGQCQYEEMNGRSVTSEGKRPLHQLPLQQCSSDVFGVLLCLLRRVFFDSVLLLLFCHQQTHICTHFSSWLLLFY